MVREMFPSVGRMRQSSEGALLHRCSLSGWGRGAQQSPGLANPAVPPRACALRGLLEQAQALAVSRSWSTVFISVVKSLRSQIPGIQLPGRPHSITLSIWPAASTSRGHHYVPNTPCLSDDRKADLAWQPENSDSRLCQAVTISWSSSQTRWQDSGP